MLTLMNIAVSGTAGSYLSDTMSFRTTDCENPKQMEGINTSVIIGCINYSVIHWKLNIKCVMNSDAFSIV